MYVKDAENNNNNNNNHTPDKICEHVFHYNHVQGRCLVHSGKQRRRASATTSGKQCTNRKKPRKKEIIFNVQVTLRNHDDSNSNKSRSNGKKNDK